MVDSLKDGWNFRTNLRGEYEWYLAPAVEGHGDWNREDVNKYISSGNVIKDNKVLKIKFLDELSETFDHTDIVIQQAICYG